MKRALNIIFSTCVVYGFWDDRRAPLKISNNGTVEWGPSFNGKTSCGMFVVYYPFDHHYCKIVFGTWFSHSEDIILIPARSKRMKQAGCFLSRSRTTFFVNQRPSKLIDIISRFFDWFSFDSEHTKRQHTKTKFVIQISLSWSSASRAGCLRSASGLERPWM